MLKKSLHAINSRLSDSKRQIEILSNGIFESGELPKFAFKIGESGHFPLRPAKLEILQINIGYMCNQVCTHCHVDAGPDRKEIMSREIMQDCLEVLKKTEVHTLDITGGAPEMNPHFRWFVEEASKIGVEDFIVRSNLTIILANKKYNDLPEFFKKHNIHVISSVPHWTQGKTDKQRGSGVFKKSIQALGMLNEVGYGKPDTSLKLDLVHNPSGAFLPANQLSLEIEFKNTLEKEYGIQFNNLFTITNLPISRFLDYLLVTGNYEDYMEELVYAYNPMTVKNVMCRNTISVDWLGNLYDCDFNQMLHLKVKSPVSHISAFDESIIQDRNIVVNQHCYGCTAGGGSSCQGAIS